LTAWLGLQEGGAVEGLRQRFVTGDWQAGKSRALATGDGEAGDTSDEEMDTFEDIETGEVFGAASTSCCVTAR
jgi:hypothetical protein